MSRGVREAGEKVRTAILQHLAEGKPNLVTSIRAEFGITRQAVYKHIDRLRAQHCVQVLGTKRQPIYQLVALEKKNYFFELTPTLEEHEVWEAHVKPHLDLLPANVLNIWSHAFTEMFNNAIDHSGGQRIRVDITKTAQSCEIRITDNGVGIFKKIQSALDLLDERHAIFELAKGKLTTDPKNHSGEGIFFTSRMLDRFFIWSGGLFFSHMHKHAEYDFLFDDKEPQSGTSVSMSMSNHSARTTKKVFDQFSSSDGDYTFNKTIIPIRLAEYGGDGLVSRSQAKRVLARVELFEKVIFDFEGVAEIGQAFADQIFRVYAREHPGIQLMAINSSPEVDQMVRRAQAAPAETPLPVVTPASTSLDSSDE
jgi:biotin operon repressor